MFTEDVIEKMIIDSLIKNGWEYIPAEELPRNYTDVMVEPMVRDALIRLNPEIAANPSYADEVIIKLIFGFGLSMLAYKLGMDEYNSKRTVLFPPK